MCDHLLEHVYRRNWDGDKVATVRFSVDVMDDGQHFLVNYACRDCAERYHLVDGDIISGEVWADDSRFPEGTPVCGACFGAWATAIGLDG